LTVRTQSRPRIRHAEVGSDYAPSSLESLEPPEHTRITKQPWVATFLAAGVAAGATSSIAFHGLDPGSLTSLVFLNVLTALPAGIAAKFAIRGLAGRTPGALGLATVAGVTGLAGAAPLAVTAPSFDPFTLTYLAYVAASWAAIAMVMIPVTAVHRAEERSPWAMALLLTALATLVVDQVFLGTFL
jgi:hypothetical protein